MRPCASTRGRKRGRNGLFSFLLPLLLVEGGGEALLGLCCDSSGGPARKGKGRGVRHRSPLLSSIILRRARSRFSQGNRGGRKGREKIGHPATDSRSSATILTSKEKKKRGREKRRGVPALHFSTISTPTFQKKREGGEKRRKEKKQISLPSSLFRKEEGGGGPGKESRWVNLEICGCAQRRGKKKKGGGKKERDAMSISPRITSCLFLEPGREKIGKKRKRKGGRRARRAHQGVI